VAKKGLSLQKQSSFIGTVTRAITRAAGKPSAAANGMIELSSMHLRTRLYRPHSTDIATTIMIMGSILVTVFLLSAAWEFWIEAPVTRFFGLPFDAIAEEQDGWRDVVTPFALAAVSLIVPGFIMIRDANERRRKYLEESYLAAIVASSSDAIIGKNLGGFIVSWNPAAEHLFGYSADEIIGRHISLVIPQARLHEEDMILERIRSGDRIVHFETVRRHMDGREISVSLTVSPIRDRDGNIVGASKIVRDVSERLRAAETLRLSEERFRSIFDAVAEGIIITDAETERLAYVNGPGAAMYGYTPDEMRGLRIETLSSGGSPYTEGGALAWIEKAATTGETQQFDWHAKRKDGSLFWAEVSLRFAFISDRKVVLAIARDVTDRREMEAQLRQALKMEAIGTLAGGVAHELNNLLQPIIMMTELVMTKLPDRGTEYKQLERVVDAGAKAGEIVQRILAFGRADEVSHSLLDLSLVVREGISFIRTIMPTSITLHIGIDEFVGLVRGDKTQLTQILINLATNARDAIGAKIGTLSVWLSKTGENFERIEPKSGRVTRGPCAILAVGDTGSGMDSETAARIFEPFFTTKGVGKGTGLGLSVTHGIVVGHGGTIQVDSKLGLGTRFTIYLPLVKPTETAATAKQKGVSDG
jgi:two-component system cell cycle sensor histidine kinase/response regulator CckA